MTFDRRSLLAVSGAGAAALALRLPNAAARTGATSGSTFPKGFLWGAATAAHQIEGNNVSSDAWLAEHVKPTIFMEPSGDACNSFHLWQVDLDLAKRIGLNTYRFSLEWARIEPEQGSFSLAMLDHYKEIIEGCHQRGLTPIVTFNHATTPRWFAARGGWTDPESPNFFVRYCDRAARHLASGIAYALTLNEPANPVSTKDSMPQFFLDMIVKVNAAAGRACGSDKFRLAVAAELPDIEISQVHLLAAHKAGRAAIKAARSNLPVGFSLALPDDEGVGEHSLRDAKRTQYYGAWLEAAKGDDFIGVQNYDRVRWDEKGMVPPPPGAEVNIQKHEIYAGSLANAVRYAHAATGVPVLVTEHGMATTDDQKRSRFIVDSLVQLPNVIAEGVPLIGYIHWSLIDNFEWMLGYSMKYGLCSVDRTTFQRTPKASAGVLGDIAQRNAVRS